nr:GGDEF domain-containing protein [Candidatus Levybacteria bacterium]
MIDGKETPQPTTQTNTPIERRGVERRELSTAEQIQATKDWLRTQREKVEKRILTQDEYDDLIARSMVAREKLTERANEKRRKDPMTGLWNKGEYTHDYAELLNSGAPFGLLIFDIDHFKNVNDTHGHANGDRILIEVSKNINSGVRQTRPEGLNDKAYRYGGEELVVLMPGMHTKEALTRVAEEIRTSIGESPFYVETDGQGLHIPITVSVGGGIHKPYDDVNFFEKIDQQGLYEAKRTGRNKTVII